MNSIRRTITGLALGAGLMAGGAAGAYAHTGSASAATTATTDTTVPAATTPSTPDASTTPAPPAGSTQTPNRPPQDPTKGGHVANGITETLLTGTTADQAKAAALAAVPGGTVQRVENDAEGDVYEAHMTKADGSHVTVKLDASFKVTTIENQ